MATTVTKTVPYTDADDNQIWLKGTGTAKQSWTFNVSGLPAGAKIKAVTLTWASGSTINTPGRTEIFKGTEEIAVNRLWYVSQSGGGGETYTIDLSSYVTGNGAYSLLFRKTANSSGTNSNVYFTGIKITITYEKTGSLLNRAENGSLVTYALYRAENGSLVRYNAYHAENGALVKF